MSQEFDEIGRAARLSYAADQTSNTVPTDAVRRPVGSRPGRCRRCGGGAGWSRAGRRRGRGSSAATVGPGVGRRVGDKTGQISALRGSVECSCGKRQARQQCLPQGGLPQQFGSYITGQPVPFRDKDRRRIRTGIRAYIQLLKITSADPLDCAKPAGIDCISAAVCGDSIRSGPA